MRSMNIWKLQWSFKVQKINDDDHCFSIQTIKVLLTNWSQTTTLKWSDNARFWGKSSPQNSVTDDSRWRWWKSPVSSSPSVRKKIIIMELHTYKKMLNWSDLSPALQTIAVDIYESNIRCLFDTCKQSESLGGRTCNWSHLEETLVA